MIVILLDINNNKITKDFVTKEMTPSGNKMVIKVTIIDYRIH